MSKNSSKEQQYKTYPGLPSHAYIDIDGKRFIWMDTTPFWREIINFFFFWWGEYKLYEPVCIDDFD